MKSDRNNSNFGFGVEVMYQLHIFIAFFFIYVSYTKYPINLFIFLSLTKSLIAVKKKINKFYKTLYKYIYIIFLYNLKSSIYKLF